MCIKGKINYNLREPNVYDISLWLMYWRYFNLCDTILDNSYFLCSMRKLRDNNGIACHHKWIIKPHMLNITSRSLTLEYMWEYRNIMQQLVSKLQIFPRVRCLNFSEGLYFEKGSSVMVVTSCCSFYHCYRSLRVTILH